MSDFERQLMEAFERWEGDPTGSKIINLSNRQWSLVLECLGFFLDCRTEIAQDDEDGDELAMLEEIAELQKIVAHQS